MMAQSMSLGFEKYGGLPSVVSGLRKKVIGGAEGDLRDLKVLCKVEVRSSLLDVVLAVTYLVLIRW